MTPSRPASLRSVSSRRHAVYANQRAWMRRAGSIAPGGHRCNRFERDGILAVRTGATSAIALPDPDALATATLTGALDWLRHEGSGDVLVWSETAVTHTDRWLAARGAREHFTPRWMTSPLNRATPSAAGPATIRPARPDDLATLREAVDLPYASPWQTDAALYLATRDLPESVVLLLAIIAGEIAGRAVLNLCETPAGTTAGIYDLGVAPRWQRRGVGRQLLHALLAMGCDRGASLATLNTTPAGERLYRALGFVEIGEGQSWLIPAETIELPPSTAETAFALAISGGETLPDDPSLARRLVPNGDTPLGHADRFDQPESAKQLLTMGTMPDLAALWQLGLHDEAREQMQTCPAAMETRRGMQRVTPVHVAVYWDDLDFLAELLAAGADPFVRDGTFDSDAFGWCHALGHDEALAILRERLPKEG